MPRTQITQWLQVWFLSLFISLANTALAAESDKVISERAKVSLVAASSKMEVGKPMHLALRIEHQPHWHTYWRNPGDSGIPTSLKFEQAEQLNSSGILWPAPKHLPLPPLASIGYEGDLYLPVEITPTAAAVASGVIKAKGDWLICKEICVPESGEFTLALKGAASGASAATASVAVSTAHTAPIDQALKQVPKSNSAIQASAYVEPTKVTLVVNGIDASLPVADAQKAMRFYPFAESVFETLPDQALRKIGGSYAIELKRTNDSQIEALAQKLGGVLVADRAMVNGLRTIEINATLQNGAPPAADVAQSASTPPSDVPQSLGLAILFAVLGGLFLNIMPCVFPVLGIKVMGFVENAHESKSLVRTQGLLFLAGVLVSFWVLAGLLLALRAGGAQLGWGFQLQSPVFVGLLALLFMAIALNLSGVFEFGMVIAGKAGEVRAKNIKSDAFFSGVLATAVATPCTAPLLGAALGYTLTQPAIISLTVFTAMALGMALPVVFLAFAPALIKKLPRPGAWMETFKQIMAFPLYATVAWLTWVFGLQVGVDGVLALSFGFVLLGLAAWVFGRFTPRAKTKGGFWASIAISIALVVGAAYIAWPNVQNMATAAKPAANSTTGANAASLTSPASNAAYWQPYDQTQLKTLVAEGKPVFVDFTAAWCVSCQFNKRTALHTDATTTKLKSLGVVAMKADWTNYDPKITAALAELNRNALPVYALYTKGSSKPMLLPEVLTQSLVLKALDEQVGTVR